MELATQKACCLPEATLPYAEIHRVLKRMPSNVRLLGVSATLAKSTRLRFVL